MVGCNPGCADEALSYNSVRFIQVKNWKIGLFYVLLQVGILVYVILFSIVKSKGYQEYDTLSGGISVKMKGAAYAQDGLVYDSNDLVRPATEANAFFATTSFIHTANQTRGNCTGNDSGTESCPCTAGKYTNNGVQTGECSAAGKYCLVQAWCPTESDDLKHTTLLQNVENWTVFIKTNIVFAKFGQQKDNVPTKALINGTNLWSLGQIANLVGANWNDIRTTGAIVLLSMYYDCDLNYDIGSSKCMPDLKWTRLDKSNFSVGFNYRYTDMTYQPDGTVRRDLNKVMGLRVMFQLYGKAGRFDIVALLLTLGSGLALLSVSRVICDLFLQHFHSSKTAFNSTKFETIQMNPTDHESPSVPILVDSAAVHPYPNDASQQQDRRVNTSKAYTSMNNQYNE